MRFQYFKNIFSNFKFVLSHEVTCHRATEECESSLLSRSVQQSHSLRIRLLDEKRTKKNMDSMFSIPVIGDKQRSWTADFCRWTFAVIEVK